MTNELPDGTDSAGPSGTAKLQAAEWLARAKSGTMTEPERLALAEWRQAVPSHDAAYRRAEALWESDELGIALRQEQSGLEAPVSQASHGMPRRRPAAFAQALAAMAAVLVLFVGAARFDDFRDALMADYAAGIGAQETVTLADGSRLVLNAGAAVTVDFSSGERNVTLLRGDAFFEVTPDPGRPFEVAAGGAVARVVGTAFGVSIAPGGTGVAVREGRVAVRGENDPDHRVELRAGRMVTVVNGRPGGAGNVDVDQAFAWLDGRLIFENWPLARVVATLDKYHAGVVVLASEQIRNYRVSGNYRVDDPPTVIRELARLAGAEVIEATDYLMVLR